MSKLQISIITVCYNSEKTIEKTIQSVNNQTYDNIEHIIIDGKSADKTYDIIKKNKKKPGLIKSEKDRSTEEAMNKGIMYSSGKIIFILHSDDFLANTNIISEVMENFNKDIDIVFGNIEYYNHFKKKLTGRKWIPGEYIYGSYLRGWHAPHPAFFAKKECYEKYGNFREDIKVAPDFELMFRFQELENLKSSYLNKTITYMGVGGKSGNIKNILRGNYEVIKSLIDHNQNFFIPFFLYKRLIPKILNKILLFLKII